MELSPRTPQSLTFCHGGGGVGDGDLRPYVCWSSIKKPESLEKLNSFTLASYRASLSAAVSHMRFSQERKVMETRWNMEVVPQAHQSHVYKVKDLTTNQLYRDICTRRDLEGCRRSILSPKLRLSQSSLAKSDSKVRNSYREQKKSQEKASTCILLTVCLIMTFDTSLPMQLRMDLAWWDQWREGTSAENFGGGRGLCCCAQLLEIECHHCLHNSQDEWSQRSTELKQSQWMKEYVRKETEDGGENSWSAFEGRVMASIVIP